MARAGRGVDVSTPGAGVHVRELGGSGDDLHAKRVKFLREIEVASLAHRIPADDPAGAPRNPHWRTSHDPLIGGAGDRDENDDDDWPAT